MLKNVTILRIPRKEEDSNFAFTLTALQEAERKQLNTKYFDYARQVHRARTLNSSNQTLFTSNLQEKKKKISHAKNLLKN